jgi:serine/threonine-protein phosphatase 2A regulatory subunit A
MKAIGEARVHSELVPYLTELTQTVDDEVLYVLAEQIENAWTHVTDKLTFLPILKILAKVDETIVRDEAAKTMEAIEASLSPKHVQSTFVPLVMELISEEWFTGRLTSSLLIPTAYPKATAKQKEKLRVFFHRLCHDEMPMVRKAAAGKIGTFAKNVEKEVLEEEIIPNYAELTQDEHDNIKLAATEKLHELVTVSPTSKVLLKIAKDAVADKSWKVRLCISKQINLLIKGFGKKIASTHILDDLTKLLKDQEGEVRQEAVHSFTKCLDLLDKKKLEQYLLPTMKETYKDDYANYKEGVAQSLCEITCLLDDDEITKSVMPLIIELMKDDSSIVKITVLEGLVKMAKALGVKIFDTNLLDQFKSMIKEPAWRVRMSVFELIGEIGRFLGRQGFSDTLEEIFLLYFSDKAAAIREKGIQKAGELADEFGREWVTEKLLPKAFENYHNEEQGYLYRM